MTHMIVHEDDIERTLLLPRPHALLALLSAAYDVATLLQDNLLLLDRGSHHLVV